MKCPHCGLFNPPEAERCDCGFDFTTRNLQRSYANQPARNDGRRDDSARTDIIVGGLICSVGIVVTLVTYVVARDNGGSYVVAWGAILFGAVKFFRGVARQR